jgi:CubicO group peptidase (beta-lactamase class C family)
MHVRVMIIVAALALVAPAPLRGQPITAPNLAGLWYAKDRFGPDARGRLIVDRGATGWRASIAGRTTQVHVARNAVAFSFPDGSGAFAGRFDAGHTALTGHWIQPRMYLNGGRMASPLTFVPCGSRCFSSEVVPLEDRYTFYVKVTRRPDGTLGAFLRNPERNLGSSIRLDRIEADGGEVRWLDARGAVIERGVLHDGVMTVFIGGRGGSYDFRKLADGAYTDFYARGRPGAPYRYTPPRPDRDGWPVAAAAEVGLSSASITRMMRAIIDAPMTKFGAHEVHAILIARHGKLVVEEYFFGEDRDKPHDTRSASKTITSILAGAVMQSGTKIASATSVYTIMRPRARSLDARKRALTLEHLLNMASGLDCDDWNDDHPPPGSEDVFTNQDAEPDWYRLILDLRSVHDPGTKFVYCAANPHLAGGMLSRATGRSIPDLMHDLVGKPVGMGRYYVVVTPHGEAYMGGGWYFRARDFMKLGQLYLDGGTWHGRRVVSAAWVKRSEPPVFRVGRRLEYGHLWWHLRYPYAGRTVHAYAATGLGGQAVMVVPELDLVFATFGGNYGDDAGWTTLINLFPRYVLAGIAPDRRR